jgi:hypothetical protein
MFPFSSPLAVTFERFPRAIGIIAVVGDLVISG